MDTESWKDVSKFINDNDYDYLMSITSYDLENDDNYIDKWNKGDLLMWDNPCLIHIGRGGIKSPGIRHMHRTMVIGEQPY